MMAIRTPYAALHSTARAINVIAAGARQPYDGAHRKPDSKVANTIPSSETGKKRLCARQLQALDRSHGCGGGQCFTTAATIVHESN
jgi:hypothetical protein